MLPRHLRRADTAVLTPEVRAGDLWREMPVVIAPVHSESGRQQVGLELKLPRRPGPIEVRVRARMPRGAEDSLETQPFDIPPHARLEFGLGILEPAWGSRCSSPGRAFPPGAGSGSRSAWST